MWAKALAAGVPEALFWASTQRELAALLKEIGAREHEAERRATLRAGLVTSAVYNTHRVNSRGQRVFHKEWKVPGDFVRQPVQVVDGATFRSMFRDLIGEGEAAEA